MNNSAFAERLYEFLKRNDAPGHFENILPEESIAEIAEYLSDPGTVKDTIRDIEEITDAMDDHETYVSAVKPLLRGLREIQARPEAGQGKRMVADTGYEVKHAVHIGGKEILFAGDDKAKDGMCWFVGNYINREITGEYSDCRVCDDYLDAMQEFTDRVSKQIEATRSEANRAGLPHEVFTAGHCRPNDYSQSIEGKVVAIKAGVLRPEYRRGDVQPVYVTGGNGAKADSRGSAVYCCHLNNGKHTRFERYDIQGEVRELPAWAKERLAAVREQIAAKQTKRLQERKDGAR